MSYFDFFVNFSVSWSNEARFLQRGYKIFKYFLN